MAIEIVKPGTQTEGGASVDDIPSSGAPGRSAGGAFAGKAKRLVRTAVPAAAALAIAVFGAKALIRFHETRSHSRAEDAGVYARRVRAQLKLGAFRLRPGLFGPTDWSRAFASPEAKRWKRIRDAFENRRWGEAVPLLLGDEPPQAEGGAEKPFPSVEQIDRAREALVSELNRRGGTLVGIQSLVAGLEPSPRVHVSSSAAVFVSGVSVKGRGVDDLRRKLSEKDWLGLANLLLGSSHEMFPPFETIRQPLQTELASIDPVLVCRTTDATTGLRVLFFADDSEAPPRVLEFQDRLPDDSGWMVDWDLHVREAFVLLPSRSNLFLKKYEELRKDENKRLETMTTRYRLGELSKEEYAQERAKKDALKTKFLAWARGGDVEIDARKNADSAAKAAFKSMEKPNRILASGTLAASNPTFVLTGSAGRKWKAMLKSYREENWKALVEAASGEVANMDPDEIAIRSARKSLDSLRVLVRVTFPVQNLADEDGPWAVELIPSGQPVLASSSDKRSQDGFSASRPFAGDPVKAELLPNDGGVSVEFPVAAAELALFIGNVETLKEELVEMNEQWRTGIDSIRRKLDMSMIDDSDAAREALSLSKRLKREFAFWLGDH